MKALGRQILVEYFDCDAALVNDVKYVRERMVDAAKQSGATVVDSVFHHFSPHGVSGVVVIAESHLAIHTWPEHRYAAVDLFTCGDTVDPWKAFRILQKAFHAKHYMTKELRRGKAALLEGKLLGKGLIRKPAEAAVARVAEAFGK